MRNIIYNLYWFSKVVRPILPKKNDEKYNDYRKINLWVTKTNNNLHKVFRYQTSTSNWWNDFTISKINQCVCVHILILFFVFV